MKSPQRKRNPFLYLIPATLAVAIVGAGATVAVGATASPTVSASNQALAKISTPFGAGKLESVTATAGTDQHIVAVRMKGDEVWPETKLAAGEHVTVIATFKRPSWNSWVAGDTKQISYSETTPSAKVISTFITRRSGDPLDVRFDAPVATVSYSRAGAAAHTVSFSARQRHVLIDESSTAGTLTVASAARSWEQPQTTEVTWFPAGSKATAIASPVPGQQITSSTPIKLTFSKPVKQVLGANMPVVTPSGAGSWVTLNAHTIEFEPAGYGYGLGASVAVELPASVDLVGGTNTATDPVGNWTVPAGSTLRLQQLLAGLGYLPVSFTQTGAATANTVAAQETAATDAPAGSFAWRYPGTPAALQQLWTPGTYGELTKGAVMAFENDHDMNADGVAGPAVWKALMAATIAGQNSTFGYTFVHVSETDPETVAVWHNGKTVASGLVNTGVSGADTATGVFAVFEHLRTTTMIGTNVDGSKYNDPGIPWVSYFNGGDALHGYIRASYGFPQSNGCVEMPYALAGEVWPYTPIGTIVDVVA